MEMLKLQLKISIFIKESLFKINLKMLDLVRII